MNINQIYKTISICLSILVLSGCSTIFTNSARCPFKDEGGCQSITDINNMIDQGRFTDNGRFVQQANFTTNQSGYDNRYDSTNFFGWSEPTPYAGETLRSNDKISRIWIAPWKDKHDDYHGENFIYFVKNKSHWMPTPVEEIQKKEFEDAS